MDNTDNIISNEDFEKLVDFSNDSCIGVNDFTNATGQDSGPGMSNYTTDCITSKIQTPVAAFNVNQSVTEIIPGSISTSSELRGQMPNKFTPFELSPAFPTKGTGGEGERTAARKKNCNAARRYREKKKKEDAEKAQEMDKLQRGASKLRHDVEFWRSEAARLHGELRSRELGSNEPAPPGCGSQGHRERVG